MYHFIYWAFSIISNISSPFTLLDFFMFLSFPFRVHHWKCFEMCSAICKYQPLGSSDRPRPNVLKTRTRPNLLWQDILEQCFLRKKSFFFIRWTPAEWRISISLERVDHLLRNQYKLWLRAPVCSYQFNQHLEIGQPFQLLQLSSKVRPFFSFYFSILTYVVHSLLFKFIGASDSMVFIELYHRQQRSRLEMWLTFM